MFQSGTYIISKSFGHATVIFVIFVKEMLEKLVSSPALSLNSNMRL